jgi:hypothetical protein
MRKIILTILLLSLCLPAFGATYYLSTTGNDTTGNGSEALPWASMAKAEASAANSDTIRMAAGTYVHPTADAYLTITKAFTWKADGAVIVRSNGTAVYALRVGAAANNNVFEPGTTGGTFTFDGRGLTASILISSTTGSTTFTNCTFTNATMCVRALAAGPIAFTGCTFTGDAGVPMSYVFDVSNAQTTLTGCTINPPSCANQALYFEATQTESVTVTGCTITGTYSNVFLQNIGNGALVFTNNTVNLGGTPRSVVVCTSATTGDQPVTISGNTITCSAPYLDTSGVLRVSAGTHTTRITNNSITFTAGAAAYLGFPIYVIDQSNVYIAENTLDCRPVTGALYSGIYVTSNGVAMTNITIRGNILKFANTQPLHAITVGTDAAGANDNKLSKVVVEYNRVYGPGYYSNPGGTLHGIIYGNNTGAVVRNNYVNGCTYGVILKGTGQDWGHQGGAFGNVIVNCANSGLYAKGVVNTVWQNNTVVNTVGSPAVQSGLMQINRNDVGLAASTGTMVRHNIFLGKDGDNLIYIFDAAQTGSDIDHNCYWSHAAAPSTAADFLDLGNTVTGWAAWQALHDQHSICANPKFVSVRNLDLRLQSNSPCINPLAARTGLKRTYADVGIQQPCYGAIPAIFEP